MGRAYRVSVTIEGTPGRCIGDGIPHLGFKTIFAAPLFMPGNNQVRLQTNTRRALYWWRQGITRTSFAISPPRCFDEPKLKSAASFSSARCIGAAYRESVTCTLSPRFLNGQYLYSASQIQSPLFGAAFAHSFTTNKSPRCSVGHRLFRFQHPIRPGVLWRQYNTRLQLQHRRRVLSRWQFLLRHHLSSRHTRVVSKARILRYSVPMRPSSAP